MNHVDKVEDTVEYGQHDIGHTEVDQEVIGDRPHSPVCCNRKVQLKCDEI